MKQTQLQMVDIFKRLERLENANDYTQTNLALFNELLGVLEEHPSGKAMLHRAELKLHLNYLVSIVLPRRKKELFEVTNDKLMPMQIKQSFVKREVGLIRKATNDIYQTQKKLETTHFLGKGI